jgi:hypothetical protein
MRTPENPISFRITTDKGYIPITLCACGVLVLSSMTGHFKSCEYLAAEVDHVQAEG